MYSLEFLKQKHGTAEKEYFAIHPEEAKTDKDVKKQDTNIEVNIWKPNEYNLSIRDFYDRELGKKVLKADISELEKIIADILNKVRSSKGNMELVADYNKIMGLLQKKKAVEERK